MNQINIKFSINDNYLIEYHEKKKDDNSDNCLSKKRRMKKKELKEISIEDIKSFFENNLSKEDLEYSSKNEK